ncbi:MAG: hypothetical protein N838_30590 [Thiohalocapsa sp. PB-PSB1]|nr:MAG: hypothetical protein N838_13095 [Thiohalocapsa sp. PB-PSB1]QQO57056.1 MAG: hypothetical protein N838_30590 [Thiohalocapsa sp. PB-PSB1]HCS90178.1 hypothetical protein [Chromatiaceae bacterium]
MKNRIIGPAIFAFIAAQAVAAPGDSWVEVVPVSNPEGFDAKVYVDAAGSRVGAYQFSLDYNADAGIQIDTSRGAFGGVSAGVDGFAASANAAEPGRITVNGFDLAGRPGKPQMHLVTVHFVGLKTAAKDLQLRVDTLATENGLAIGP